MSWYAPRAAISHFALYKRGNQTIHFGISVQSDYSHSIEQVHALSFLPKQIMMSLEHHVVIS